MTASTPPRWWTKAAADLDPKTLDRIWIGTISRSAREYLGISQAQLGLHTGLVRTTILAIEKSSTVPDYRTAALLRTYFETAGIVVDVDDDDFMIQFAVQPNIPSASASDLVAKPYLRWIRARDSKRRAVRTLLRK